MKNVRENKRLCEKVYPSREVKSKACAKTLNKLKDDDLVSAREDLHNKMKFKKECKAKFPGTTDRALKNRKKCQEAKEATKDVNDDTEDLDLSKKVDKLADKAVAKAAKAQAKLEKKQAKKSKTVKEKAKELKKARKALAKAEKEDASEEAKKLREARKAVHNARKAVRRTNTAVGKMGGERIQGLDNKSAYDRKEFSGGYFTDEENKALKDQFSGNPDALAGEILGEAKAAFTKDVSTAQIARTVKMMESPAARLSKKHIRNADDA